MLLQINRKHEKKIKIVGKAGPVTCHRISRSLSHHSANLFDLYTFFRRALNRAKYPEKHRIVAKSQQILRRMDDRSRGGSERGKNSKRGERSEYDNQPSTRFRLFLGWNRTIIQFSIAEICTRRLHAEADGVGRLYSFFPPGPPVELFPRRSDASSWVQPALESSPAIKLISSRFRDFFFVFLK